MKESVELEESLGRMSVGEGKGGFEWSWMLLKAGLAGDEFADCTPSIQAAFIVAAFPLSASSA